MVGDDLRNDIAGASEGIGDGFNFECFVEVFCRLGIHFSLGDVLVFQEEGRERLESAVFGLGCASLAFGAEGSEGILKGAHGQASEDFLLEFGGKEVAFFQGFEDGGAAGIEFDETDHAVADGGDLNFIEFARGFFAVSGDERNGSTFGDEFRGCGDAAGGNAGFLSDDVDVVRMVWGGLRHAGEEFWFFVVGNQVLSGGFEEEGARGSEGGGDLNRKDAKGAKV